jgi:hypothetical protein
MGPPFLAQPVAVASRRKTAIRVRELVTAVLDSVNKYLRAALNHGLVPQARMLTTARKAYDSLTAASSLIRPGRARRARLPGAAPTGPTPKRHAKPKQSVYTPADHDTRKWKSRGKENQQK